MNLSSTKLQTTWSDFGGSVSEFCQKNLAYGVSLSYPLGRRVFNGKYQLIYKGVSQFFFHFFSSQRILCIVECGRELSPPINFPAVGKKGFTQAVATQIQKFLQQMMSEISVYQAILSR